MNGISKLGPMAAMATMSIAQQEQALGVTLKGDFFGSLDATMIDIQKLSPPTNTNPLPTISAVTMIKLKDKPRFMAAVEAIKKLAGDGFKMFEETEHEGATIYSVKPSLTPGADGADNNESPFSYCITDEYVILAQGGVQMLHKVLARLKNADGPSAWDAADVQAALAALPKDYTGAGIAKSGALLRTLATTLAKFQESSDKVLKKAKDGDKDTRFIDTSATPPDAVFEKYFGTGVSGVYALPQAIQMKYLMMPPQAQ
jgi:hypothetical protein